MTAYEMRISDWSSDVCSSELRRPEQTVTGSDADVRALNRNREVVQRCQGLRIHQPREWRGCLRPFPCDPDRGLQESGGRPEGQLHRRAGPEEIGRASCRESVGLHVELSVVAVSLQKERR